MLYYVRTGSLDTSLDASSHLDAAKKVAKNEADCGMLVVVSDREITEEGEDNVYFLTENLKMRLVV